MGYLYLFILEVAALVCQRSIFLILFARGSSDAASGYEYTPAACYTFRQVLNALLDTVKARMLAYHGHVMRKQRSCLDTEIAPCALGGGVEYNTIQYNTIQNL